VFARRPICVDEFAFPNPAKNIKKTLKKFKTIIYYHLKTLKYFYLIGIKPFLISLQFPLKITCGNCGTTWPRTASRAAATTSGAEAATFFLFPLAMTYIK
jgi:hypothetical protein